MNVENDNKNFEGDKPDITLLEKCHHNPKFASSKFIRI